MAATTPALTELLLSSTSSSSPLPTTTLHSLQTGASLFSFKSPVASTSTTTQANGGKDGDKDQPSLKYRKTMGMVQAQGGVGGVVMGLGGKDGRAGINVWGFQKVRQAQQYTEECLGADAEVLLDQRSKFSSD